MIPSCNAMAQLATSGSSHAKVLGDVCIAVCEDSEKECREHEDKHEVCKECGDACAGLIEALKTAQRLPAVVVSRERPAALEIARAAGLRPIADVHRERAGGTACPAGRQVGPPHS